MSSIYLPKSHKFGLKELFDIKQGLKDKSKDTKAICNIYVKVIKSSKNKIKDDILENEFNFKNLLKAFKIDNINNNNDLKANLIDSFTSIILNKKNTKKTIKAVYSDLDNIIKYLDKNSDKDDGRKNVTFKESKEENGSLKSLERSDVVVEEDVKNVDDMRNCYVV
jgi:hypothetical protein